MSECGVGAQWTMKTDQHWRRGKEEKTKSWISFNTKFEVLSFWLNLPWEAGLRWWCTWTKSVSYHDLQKNISEYFSLINRFLLLFMPVLPSDYIQKVICNLVANIFSQTDKLFSKALFARSWITNRVGLASKPRFLSKGRASQFC